jgi:hypothetical protein
MPASYSTFRQEKIFREEIANLCCAESAKKGELIETDILCFEFYAGFREYLDKMLWTIRETADAFGVADQTVYAWIRKDQLPDGCVVHIGPRGRQVRIDSDLMPSSMFGKRSQGGTAVTFTDADGEITPEKTIHPLSADGTIYRERFSGMKTFTFAHKEVDERIDRLSVASGKDSRNVVDAGFTPSHFEPREIIDPATGNTQHYPPRLYDPNPRIGPVPPESPKAESQPGPWRSHQAAVLPPPCNYDKRTRGRGIGRVITKANKAIEENICHLRSVADRSNSLPV